MSEKDEQGPAPGWPSGLEVFLAWPLAAASHIAQTNIRLFETLLPPANPRPSRRLSFPWASQNKISLELGTMCLRDFSTRNEGRATLICAPYALHGATIADFATGHSVVERLAQCGLSRLFVTEWQSATPDMRYFTIDNYLADLNVAVDEIGPPVDLIGLCQGGWLALVYAARFPNKVRRLVLVGSPRASCTANRCSGYGGFRTAPMKPTPRCRRAKLSSSRSARRWSSVFGNGTPRRSICPAISFFRWSSGCSRKTESRPDASLPLGRISTCRD